MDIYGGATFEDIVREASNFFLQCELYNRGVIKGIQVRVIHPLFTPGISALDLPKILEKLPSGLKILIHFAHESNGVDPGKVFDERNVFAENKGNRSWDQWNEESFKWGTVVAQAAGLKEPYGVAHVGYCLYEQRNNLETITSSIQSIGGRILLENVPPLVIKSLRKEETTGWENFYWGAGGLPEQMGQLLEATRSLCLIDFTHLIVAWNQIDAGYIKGPNTLAKLVQGFLDLRHSPICHLAGTPSGFIDVHSEFEEEALPEVVEAVKRMEVICVESPLYKKKTPEEAEIVINRLQKKYKL